MSALDEAHAAMLAAPEDEAARRQYFGLVAASELMLVLEAEPVAGRVRPLVLETGQGRLVPAFDNDARLADFLDAPMPHLVLSGRAIVRMLAGQGLSLAINLGAETGYVLTPDVLDWMAEAATRTPEAETARPERLLAPRNASEALLRALDQRLAMLAGLAETAWLAEDPHGALLLALSGVSPERREQVAALLAEARNFTDPEQALDVVFVETGAPLAARLHKIALRFDIPTTPQPPPPRPPGRDPDKPPRLR